VSQQAGSDTLQVRFGVWNRALRAVATPVRVQMSTASAGVLFERTFPVEIPPDTLREFVVLLPSTGWALQDTLSLRGWSPGELYAFNDRAAVPVQKQPDQEPPKLELWWQQEETVVRLQQGMSIERRPRLWAILQDNLPLLSAARALTLWIDGRRMDSTTAEHYRVYAAEQFAQLPEQIRQSLPQQARVVVECLPRLLPPGTVLLRLVGEDAAGLRDTLALELLVTTERRILLQRLFPQPGGDELRVDFLLQSYHPQERVRAELFDLTGHPVWSEGVRCLRRQQSVELVGKGPSWQERWKRGLPVAAVDPGDGLCHRDFRHLAAAALRHCVPFLHVFAACTAQL
jgi:hypothetical protein